jgi:hypothetical protein
MSIALCFTEISTDGKTWRRVSVYPDGRPVTLEDDDAQRLGKAWVEHYAEQFRVMLAKGTPIEYRVLKVVLEAILEAEG